jgi:type IX secretion system PorP/SprF family membrane protein
MKGLTDMTRTTRFALLLCALSTSMARAQEPAFMQFNSDPLNISPALAGRAGTDLRVLANARSQWLGKSTMYNTQSVTIDGKLRELDEKNYFGIGGMFISDKAMEGLFKSNHYSINGSYHMALGPNGSGLALGIGIVGNNTRADFSQLSFDSQLGSSGFDLSLPSGESSLRNSTFYTSATAGLLYTFESDNVYFDVGFSGYRFATFAKSFYNDPKQVVYPRYSLHSYLSATISDRLSIQGTAMNMIVHKRNIIYAGVMLGIIMAENDPNTLQMLHLGAYYRSSGAIAPCVGYTFGNFDIGLSSDVNISSSTGGAAVNRALELTMAYNLFSDFYRRKVGRYHNPL